MTNSLQNKNILVTGGAGFIGCALSQRLAAECKRYVAVDSLLAQVHPQQIRPTDLHAAAELVVADVTQPKTWTDLFAEFRPDIVVHLAAETGTGQSLKQSTMHGRSNVLGLTVLLDALSKNEIEPEQILCTSSRAVYGEGAWQKENGEIFYPGQRTNAQLASGKWDFDGVSLPSTFGDTRENPTSVYGATKLAQENILKSWSFSFGVPLTLLRLQNVYGPGQSPFNPYTGIVVLFSRLARAKKKVELYEDGLVTRDFVYIDDVVDALVKSVLQSPANGYRALDIGSGEVTTLIDIAQKIGNFHGAPESFISGKYRNGDVRHSSCNIAAAKQELGWQPESNLDKGLSLLQAYLSTVNLVEV
ncbi:MAG: NAD-dependent epimerase/dehydratase family protein [Candidatus Obscuribacterales bacterium]|nr:NAD-dependent epimerase/dehydratase family protein [Candidatus Obscuribacterales bacterium]